VIFLAVYASMQNVHEVNAVARSWWTTPCTSRTLYR